MLPYQTILITGGAGFVGANLAIWLKTKNPNTRIIALDNLKRRGSEFNLPRLKEHSIEFVHGDIRNPEDLRLNLPQLDLLLECSAEPSVLAGYGSGPGYVLNTNLVGTLNCLEVARQQQADFLFLSTSRVYPVAALNRLETVETDTRLELAATQTLSGASANGINEQFSLAGARSLYGATKLSSELIIQEYGEMYGLRYIINRCGVIAGPWQMGKVDQGVFALWLIKHYFQQELSYIGWGGSGKQVRDLLHIDDLAALVGRQLQAFDKFNGEIFNVGGGRECSLSLLETTQLCREITGRQVSVHHVPETRPADLKLYITDNSHVTRATGWQPRLTPRQTLVDIFQWLQAEEATIRHLWA